MNDLIAIDEVNVGYRTQPLVLEATSATFEEGMTHSITGPSGCGKSTLLYVAGLMLRPKSGRVVVAGVDHARSTDAVRARARANMIGFVFQDALLEPSMTAWQNIMEGIPLTRSSRPYREAARNHLDRMGIAHLADRLASQLSGGQSQRIALVRAILKDAPILLADEPTGNLDDDTAELVLDELFRFGARPGHTTVIVTHDERVAARTDTVIQLATTSAAA